MDWVICFLLKDVLEMFAQWREKQLPVGCVQSFFGLEAALNLLMLILFVLLPSFSFHRQQHGLWQQLGFRQKLPKNNFVLIPFHSPDLPLQSSNLQKSLLFELAHGALPTPVIKITCASICVSSLPCWQNITFTSHHYCRVMSFKFCLNASRFSQGICPEAGVRNSRRQKHLPDGTKVSGFQNLSESFQDVSRVAAKSRRADRRWQSSVTQLAPLTKTIAVQGVPWVQTPLRLCWD